VIVLDQFPRNIHRNTSRAFAQDAVARARKLSEREGRLLKLMSGPMAVAVRLTWIAARLTRE
jgi:hypothetical protein